MRSGGTAGHARVARAKIDCEDPAVLVRCRREVLVSASGGIQLGQLDGKVAIVTGSSRGIGKAVAIGFAREGARVVLCGRTTDAGAAPLSVEAAAQEIEALGGEALPIACDVTDEAQVDDMVGRAIREWGRIDVLINNAGLKWGRSIDDTPLDKWRDVFNTNVHAVYICTMAVLPHMREQHSGSIVTVSSSQAQSDTAGGAVYAASKSAADRFMIKLAAELKGEGIALNALYPGSTLTELSLQRSGGDRGGRQTAEEKKIIPACVYLAGQTDDGLTGQILDQAEFEVSWP